MRITLEPLKKAELQFVLDVLNASAGRDSATRLRDLDAAGMKFSEKALRGKLAIEPWHYGKIPSDHQIVIQCSAAQRSIASVVVEQRSLGGFFFDLRIGLPAHKPPVILTDLSDLANWLLARAVANKQHLRFVKCMREDCGKFGLRRRARADSRYCSRSCQIAETAYRAKLREPKKPAKQQVRFAAPQNLRKGKSR